jgi:hypothetical protein
LRGPIPQFWRNYRFAENWPLLHWALRGCPGALWLRPNRTIQADRSRDKWNCGLPHRNPAWRLRRLNSGRSIYFASTCRHMMPKQRSDNIRSLRFRGWTFRQKPATQGEARLQAQDIARRAPYDRVDVRHRNVASSLIACTHIYMACWILTRASACLSDPMFLSARSVPPTRDSRELPRPEKSDDVLVIMQRCKDKRPAARPNLCA